MTTNTDNTQLKYDLSPQGIGELMKAPILATLSFLDFPYITITREQGSDGKPPKGGFTLHRATNEAGQGAEQ